MNCKRFRKKEYIFTLCELQASTGKSPTGHTPDDFVSFKMT